MDPDIKFNQRKLYDLLIKNNPKLNQIYGYILSENGVKIIEKALLDSFSNLGSNFNNIMQKPQKFRKLFNIRIIKEIKKYIDHLQKNLLNADSGKGAFLKSGVFGLKFDKFLDENIFRLILALFEDQFSLQ